MKIMNLTNKNLQQIVAKIVEFLEQGRVLICPTDTVYGLVCDATNEKAVERIFEIKKRDKGKPLLLFVENIEKAKEIAIIDDKKEGFLKKNWPGKTTVILKVKTKMSELVSKNGTVGLRMPNYKFLNLILKEFGKPLAQTSANVSGQPATTKIKEILEQFSAYGGPAEGRKKEDIAVVDAGDLPNNKPSTIIDLTGQVLTRLR